MKFQALLLSSIILISLLIGGNSFSSSQSYVETEQLAMPIKNVELSNAPQAKMDNPTTIFIKDFYSALSEKMNSAGQDLTIISRNVNQNLAAAKEIFSFSINNLFADSSENLNISPSNYSDSVSVENLNIQDSFCNPDKSDFTSKAILIKYLDQNFNVFELNPEKRWPIASLTKLMVAVVALEKIDSDKKITMSEKAVSTEGEVGDFKAGEVFKVKDLIKAMLISSSNDAAMAIAENFDGGEKEFVNETQKKAAELKMFSTTYLEPTGLSFINQSTVNDLMKLAIYIYFNHPEILEISRLKEISILELNSNRYRKLTNIDKFAGEADFLGGKTGYIEEAGRNLVAFFKINGGKFLTITLGADDSFKETEMLKDAITECR